MGVNKRRRWIWKKKEELESMKKPNKKGRRKKEKGKTTRLS